MEVSLEEKIIGCRRIIKYNLIPSDILDHLEAEECISREDRECVLKCEHSEWIRTTDMLLDQLSASTHPHWGRVFTDALSQKSYTKLVKMIENFPGSTELHEESELFQKIIRLNHASILTRKLQITPLCVFLQKENILSKEDIEIITAKHDRGEKMLANRELLRRVYRKKESWFPDLLCALMDVGCKDIVYEIVGATDDKAVQEKLKSKKSLKEMQEYCMTWLMEMKNEGSVISEDPNQSLVDDCTTAMHHLSIFGFPDTADTEAAPHSEDLPDLARTEATSHSTNWNNSGSSKKPHFDTGFQKGLVPAEKFKTCTPQPNVAAHDEPLSLNIGLDSSPVLAQKDTAKGAAKVEDEVMNILSGAASSEALDQLNIPDNRPGEDKDDDCESDEDNDMPVEQQEELSLREYQLELARPALQGKNTVVVAPTGTGKTHVALWITKHHFENWNKDVSGKDARVVFLVPTVALVSQQRKQFKTYLGKYRCKGFSGVHTFQGQMVPFGMLYKDNDIIIATPQLLANAVIRDQSIESLDEFSLIIFDECHKANTKGHPYKVILRQFLQEKFPKRETMQNTFDEGKKNMPQVIGLTASVGVGKGNTLSQAVDHIFRLCGALDADAIQTVTENVKELDDYRTVPIEDIQLVSNKTHDPFKEAIRKTMFVIEYLLEKLADKILIHGNSATSEIELKKFKKRPLVWQSQMYTQWVYGLTGALNMITDEETRRMMFACIDELKIYNEALFLNDYCRSQDAMDYIINSKTTHEDTNMKHQNDTDIYLQKLFLQLKPRLEDVICSQSTVLNEKLATLKRVIQTHRREVTKLPNVDIRGIVFCKTREMTQALMNWMLTDEDLKDLKAQSFTSAHASSEVHGQTQEQQSSVLSKFRSGECKMLIATTIAEEGLDIPECNLVIRYNHVTNETARIQAKGRGRASNAVYVLIGEGEVVAKEEVNQQREVLMMEAVRDINKLSVLKFQAKVHICRAEVLDDGDSKPLVVKRKYPGIKLKCQKCLRLACTVDDLRVIKEIHHTVINEDFHKVCRVEKHPKPKAYDEFKKIGKIYCDHCHYDWGIEQRYKEVNFLVIKISSFVVENEDGRKNTYKKWADLPFQVQKLTPEDLRRESEIATAAMSALASASDDFS